MQKTLLFFMIAFCISLTGYSDIGTQPVRYGLGMAAIKKNKPTKTISTADKYAEVDAYVKTADKYDKNLSDLVDYLIRPYQQNEELKARAIFAWMIYNLNYDSFKADNITGNTKTGKRRLLNSGNVFKTRIGVCGDFADLFVQMAKRANLRAVRINGVAGSKLTRSQRNSVGHAWNAVRINKKWYFVDVTWGMQGDYMVFQDMEKVRDYRRAVRERRRNTEDLTVPANRSINEKWFLTPPEVMIETHFPDEIKWQLLDNPVNARDIFKQNEKQRERKSNKIQPVKLKRTQ